MGCCASTSQNGIIPPTPYDKPVELKTETSRVKKEERKTVTKSIFQTKYKIGNKLGDGAISSVYQATEIQSGLAVAVKYVNRDIMSEEDERNLRREAEILRIIDHPSIVKCIDFIEEDKSFYLVMELLEGGDFLERIVRRSVYTEKMARDVITVLLSALKFCHDHGIVHRDIKPENLLLKSTTNDFDIKLADFGFAVWDHGKNELTDPYGTAGYAAPEILKQQKYGSAIDMWATGIITYIILGGSQPFRDDDYPKIFAGDFTFPEERWEKVSEDAKDFIRKMLVPDPTQRISAASALQHRWGEDDLILAARDISSPNLKNLKSYVNHMKLKGAVDAVMAANRMSSGSQERRRSRDLCLILPTSSTDQPLSMDGIDVSQLHTNTEAHDDEGGGEEVKTQERDLSDGVGEIGGMEMKASAVGTAVGDEGADEGKVEAGMEVTIETTSGATTVEKETSSVDEETTTDSQPIVESVVVAKEAEASVEDVVRASASQVEVAEVTETPTEEPNLEPALSSVSVDDGAVDLATAASDAVTETPPEDLSHDPSHDDNGSVTTAGVQ